MDKRENDGKDTMNSYLNETDEVRAIRNRFCELIRSGAAPAMCKLKLWAELKNAVVREAFGKAGKAVPPESLEPFGVPRARELTAVIRCLYRHWDAGKLTDREFLDKAHAVNADFEVLLAHDKVSDADAMRYTDEYSSSIMAVTDVCEGVVARAAALDERLLSKGSRFW